MCVYTYPTHISGQAGWGGGSGLTRTSSGGQMGLVRHCQAAFCQVTHPLCCGGGGEASTGAGWILVPGWSNLMEEAPAGPSSAQQPVTLGLSHLSLSKAGRRDFIVARVTHALFLLSISPEVGEECTLGTHFEPVWNRKNSILSVAEQRAMLTGPG